MTNGVSHRPKTTMTQKEPRVPKEPVVPTEPTEPAEPVAPAEPTEPKEPVEPTTPTEPTEPVTPPVEPVTPPKEPKDVPPVVPEKRPVAYIPLKKYHEETGELKKKITELEAIVANKTPEDKGPFQVDSAKIQAYADKHGIDPEEVLDLLALLPKPESGITMSKEDLEEFNKIVTTSKDQARIEFEKKDWLENAVPTIKELFPTATEEQIKAAQVLLDPIAHTEEGVNQGYDYIVFKNKSKLAEIFKAATPAAPTSKATLEPGKNGAGSPTRLTVKDFAGENPDFSVLEDLSPEDKGSIVKSFEGNTYKKYLAHVAAKQPLEVNRGGKKVFLK